MINYANHCITTHRYLARSGGMFVNICKMVGTSIILFLQLTMQIILSSENIDKAEAFNSFFTSIFNLEENKHLPTLLLDTPSNIDSITITQSDIKDVHTLLKSPKASGPDGINQRILKEGAQFIIETLYTF